MTMGRTKVQAEAIRKANLQFESLSDSSNVSSENVSNVYQEKSDVVVKDKDAEEQNVTVKTE